MNTQTSKKSFLARLSDFLYSLYLVLVGDLRASKYEELEDHLDFLFVNLTSDDRWLSVLPEIRPVVERHFQMVSSEWRSVQFEDISTFREKLKRTIEAERLFPPTKINQG